MSIALINTRPSERAKKILTQGDEYYLPLLALLACPLDDVLAQQLQQLSQVDVAIVVSPMAVQVLMDYVRQLGLDIQHYQHIQWLAVGKSTAECLENYGIVAQIPELETSEGMFQLPIFDQNIQRVAFLRGHDGREWLMQQLDKQGIDIINILLYRREFPQSSIGIWYDIYPKLLTYQQIFVLISSGASWQNWLNLVQLSILQSFNLCYLVLGERVYRQVVDNIDDTLQHHQALCLNNLQHDTILTAIQSVQERVK